MAGFDTSRFLKANGKIRGCFDFPGNCIRLEIKEPVTGTHKLTGMQALYEDVSRFLDEQT